ncbi:MAG: LytTR family DNA-binding domain-containing protein [Saprospiraceae bacterium]|nr:response regulator transcription factor [Lewinella sp.]
MNRIVIIEDEPFAADHLELLIRRLRSDTEIVTKLATVAEAIAWLHTASDYDLIFSDIQLGDGICFDIFREINVQVPIIFTTAYDQYALRAFKVNSVDYLLKPIDLPSLQAAFEKLDRLRVEPAQALSPMTTSQLDRLLQSMRPDYKQRFAVKIGDHIKMIPVSEVVYFESRHKLTYLFTENGKKYPVQYTLHELEELLDPRLFFRINRQMLLRDTAIQDVAAISNSRLKVSIPFTKDTVVVSRERCQEFKEWMDQ